VLHIGQGDEGDGGNSAHIDLILGSKAVLGNAFASAAASPGAGHVSVQALLRPDLPARPATLFVGKASIKGEAHQAMTLGPAQAGVAAGITQALLDGVLPKEAEEGWLAIASVWVDGEADDAQAVYANNLKAAYAACQRAMIPGWPGREALAAGVANVSNPYFTPSIR
jgi:5,6,7,8-tetrahydromethanopterin hydro-lyase